MHVGVPYDDDTRVQEPCTLNITQRDVNTANDTMASPTTSSTLLLLDYVLWFGRFRGMGFSHVDGPFGGNWGLRPSFARLPRFARPFLPSRPNANERRVKEASHSRAYTHACAAMLRRSQWTFKERRKGITWDHPTTTTDHRCHHLARLFCYLHTYTRTKGALGGVGFALRCLVFCFGFEISVHPTGVKTAPTNRRRHPSPSPPPLQFT